MSATAKNGSPRERRTKPKATELQVFYLVVRILDEEKCIDSNASDIYADGDMFNCLRSLPFSKKRFLRKITVSCTQDPSVKAEASVYTNT